MYKSGCSSFEDSMESLHAYIFGDPDCHLPNSDLTPHDSAPTIFQPCSLDCLLLRMARMRELEQPKPGAPALQPQHTKSLEALEPATLEPKTERRFCEGDH